MVLDGGGHFSPAGIDGVHTLTLLFSSHTALDRAEGNPHTHNNQHRQTNTTYRLIDLETLTNVGIVT